jgi:hypothetical protein
MQQIREHKRRHFIICTQVIMFGTLNEGEYDGQYMQHKWMKS